MRIHLSDDHIFYASLGLAFSVFLLITFSITEAQSTARLSFIPDHNVQLAKPQEKPLDRPAKKEILFRQAVDSTGPETRNRIVSALVGSGYPCPHITSLKPLALSGMYQASCIHDTVKDTYHNYIYNMKSGFIHKL